MEHKYHCQHQAEQFARQVIAVPEMYPLKPGLPEEFPKCFAALCALAKSIYLDMAQYPEAYGLMLLDHTDADHNAARDSYRTIHRFADALSALFLSGEVSEHRLRVDAAKFRSAIKPVSKYGLILGKLCGFGFAITDFDGTTIDKKSEAFTVEYPGDPRIIDTLKTYCDCWDKLKGNRKEIKLQPKEFHHHFYRFDYKITADMARIPIEQWVADDADSGGYSPEIKAFALAFYRQSLRYKGLKFDGEYYCKGKRIARITATDYAALGDPRYMLSIKLKEMDRYMDFVQSLPDSITGPMKQSNCRHCNFQGATEEHCKFRLYWTMNGTRHTGCAHACFFFDDFTPDRVADYWKLLELEYSLH